MALPGPLLSFAPVPGPGQRHDISDQHQQDDTGRNCRNTNSFEELNGENSAYQDHKRARRYDRDGDRQRDKLGFIQCVKPTNKESVNFL